MGCGVWKLQGDGVTYNLHLCIQGVPNKIINEHSYKEDVPYKLTTDCK